MTTTYEVRQRVYTVKESWNVVVFSSTSERVARQTYEHFTKNNDGYFVLVKIEHKETCLEYTK